MPEPDEQHSPPLTAEENVRQTKFSAALDAEMTVALPYHFHGERKLRLRLEHVVTEWLAGRSCAPALEDKP